MGTSSPPPDFDAAAAAAQFCQRAVALPAVRDLSQLREALIGDLGATPDDFHVAILDTVTARAWSDFVAAGGTLAELYGLEGGGGLEELLKGAES